MHAGDLEFGERFLLEGATLARAGGDDYNRGNILLNLSELRLSLGRLGEAEASAREALTSARRREDRPRVQSRNTLVFLARARPFRPGRGGAARLRRRRRDPAPHRPQGRFPLQPARRLVGRTASPYGP